MRYFSTFTGVGGFEIGIRNAYANYHSEKSKERDTNNAHLRVTPGEAKPDTVPVCVGFSEIDKYASAVLRYRSPDTKNYGDITKIDWSTVPDFDLLVGGSPCQSFSVAGKRAGFAGASGLFWEYLRCLKEKQPEYFIWENVKGCLSSNHGYDFAAILNSFSEAGYSLWWQVLNAKDFGVPQNRERIFVVGSRNRPAREVLFERGENRKDPGTIQRCPIRFLERNQKNIQGDYAFTVDAGQTAGVTDGMRVRRLTLLECERLMSWPDDWTKYGLYHERGRPGDVEVYETSDSQRYKMCGNGVVSKVVEEVVRAHLL